jgi:hypothetical protein
VLRAQASLGLHERAPDTQLPTVVIYILPTQRQQFTPPHACGKASAAMMFVPSSRDPP